MTTSAAETARRALDILDRDGWNKGSVTTYALDDEYQKGSHCVGGAWNLADHDGDMWGHKNGLSANWREDLEYLNPLADLICAEYPDLAPVSPLDMRIVTIAQWNNHPDTTEEDVRRLLEKIASG